MKTLKIQELVNKISLGDFTSSDIGLLFVWLRPAFVNDHVLLDLSNFVAHSEGRDRGVAFDHINAFVLNFLQVSEKGGRIGGLTSVFQKHDVMERLAVVLRTSGINFDKTTLESHTHSLINCIQELMEETDFVIDDSRIIRCFAKKTNSTMQFCLQADLNGPAIKMGPGALICSNLFD